MAKAIRIDGVTIDASGAVSVSYTAGETPLPSASGSVLSFASRQALVDAVEAFQTSVNNEQLAFFALSTWIKADPQMQNPGQATNNGAEFDLLGASAAIKLT